MTELSCDVLVLGAGAAGMGAALSAARQGVRVTMVERVEGPGGILGQCIHNGFGLHYFKQELTGPEYATRLWSLCRDAGVDFRPGRFLLDIHPRQKTMVFASPEGVERIGCSTMVYAAGARERPFGSLLIPGDRVSGIYTAGVAQRLVNIENRKPGTRALILGSGDIGLIMARRLHLEGIEVVGVLERMAHPGGLERNIQQCLVDFGIPLHLSTTVAEVRGRGRLEEVTTVRVDRNFNPIAGSQRTFAVDTLVLSVGLVPSTTPLMATVHLDPKSRGVICDSLGRTSREWVFAAGNCVGIYDLADWVSTEGEKAGKVAALHATGHAPAPSQPLVAGPGVGVLLPHSVATGSDADVYFRPSAPMERGLARIHQGDHTIQQTDPRPLSPGEMEHLRLKAGTWDETRHLEVEVVHAD